MWSRCLGHNVAHFDIGQDSYKLQCHKVWRVNNPCGAYGHIPW